MKFLFYFTLDLNHKYVLKQFKHEINEKKIETSL